MNVVSTISKVLKGNTGAAATLQTFFSRILILGINVSTGIITARALGPDGRGEQAAMILWSMFLANTVTLGLPSSIVYNFKRYPEQRSELFAASLLLGTLLGSLASLIGIIFIPSWLSQYSPEIVRLAQWFMLNAPIALLLLVSSAALEAHGNFAASNQIRFLIPFTTLLLLCGLAVTGNLNPFTTSLAYIVNGIPIFIWMQIRLWQLFRPRLQNLGRSCKRLFYYGSRSYGIDLLNALARQTDQAFVVGSLSPAAMGMYVVALSLSRVLNVFQTSIVTVLFPKAAARPVEEVIELTGRAARISSAMTLMVGIAIMLVGPLLLKIMYGSEYIGAIAVLRILIVEVVLSGTILILAQAFMASGRPGIVTILQGLGLGLSVPLMLTLIPAYGLVGAGLSLLGSTIARLFFILICYPIVLKVRPPNLLLTIGDLHFLKQKVQKMT